MGKRGPMVYTIENETRWNTEDLVAIAKKVEDNCTPIFRPHTPILLFSTNRERYEDAAFAIYESWSRFRGVRSVKMRAPAHGTAGLSPMELLRIFSEGRLLQKDQLRTVAWAIEGFFKDDRRYRLDGRYHQPAVDLEHYSYVDGMRLRVDKRTNKAPMTMALQVEGLEKQIERKERGFKESMEKSYRRLAKLKKTLEELKK